MISNVENFATIGRSYEIYTRLREISNGKGPEILKTTYDRESKAKTWCIGVSWDYDLDAFLQITEVSCGERE